MDYIDKFSKDLEGLGRSKNTIGNYIIDTKQFIEFYGSRNDADVTQAIQLDLLEYKKHLQNVPYETVPKPKYYKVTTINRKLVSVNTFFKYMYDNDYTNSIISIETVEDKDELEFKGLDDKEAWQLRKEIHRNGSERDVCVFELLSNTGIRVSELVNIKLSDIEITDRKGSVRVLGKGNANRTLPLNIDIRKAIDGYLLVRKDNPNEYLLQGQRGRMTRKGIDSLLKVYGKRLGIDVSAHKLRHTLAYKLIKSGVAITTIRDILGHNDINITLIYTQTMYKDKEDALDNIEW